MHDVQRENLRDYLAYVPLGATPETRRDDLMAVYDAVNAVREVLVHLRPNPRDFHPRMDDFYACSSLVGSVMPTELDQVTVAIEGALHLLDRDLVKRESREGDRPEKGWYPREKGD